MEMEIKKVTRKLYSINYDNILLEDRAEFIASNRGIDEFAKYLRFDNRDNNSITTFSGYRKGLFYFSDNGGEIVAVSKFEPDIISFKMNIYGTIKNRFYRLIVKARDTDGMNIVTHDRTLVVTDDSDQVVIQTDLKGSYTHKNTTGYFRATGADVNLFFTLGKIAIKDIIVEEVVLAEEEKIQEITDSEADETLSNNKISLAAYGVFNLKPTKSQSFGGRYIQLEELTGKGLVLTLDSKEKHYILERSNVNEVLPDSFTGIEYLVDFNTNKIVSAGKFDKFEIIKITSDISPTTFKQGYIVFAFIKDGKKIQYDEDYRIYISINKIY